MTHVTREVSRVELLKRKKEVLQKAHLDVADNDDLLEIDFLLGDKMRRTTFTLMSNDNGFKTLHEISDFLKESKTWSTWSEVWNLDKTTLQWTVTISFDDGE